MKNAKKWIVALSVACALFAGCAPANTPGTSTPAPTDAPVASPSPVSTQSTTDSTDPVTDIPGGEIMVMGSTSAEALVSALADQYSAVNPNIVIAVQGNGSSAGIKAATEGTAQLGMSSRELKEEEKAGVTATIICMDGIAVIVNKENAATDLTAEQIAQIFKGEITNWKEVGGADEEILLISREAGSGTRDAFEEILKLTQKNDAGKTVSLVDEGRALIADSTNAVSTTVSTKKNAIGYISLGSYDAGLVTALKVGGVACAQDTILDGTYAIARPFLLIEGSAQSEAAKAFLAYALSDEGQKVVTDHKFIPVK